MSTRITTEVDLRSFFLGVRDQEARPTCLACATTDAHWHRRDHPRPFCPEFLYGEAARYLGGRDGRGLTLESVQYALRHSGQPEEMSSCPGPRESGQLAATPIGYWHAEVSNTAPLRLELIQSTLRDARCVVLGIRLVDELLELSGSGAFVDDGSPGIGGHAVLAVGLGMAQSVGPLVLVRNSWGPGWGDGGYGWLSFRFLQANLLMMATVAPIGRAS